MDALPRAEQRGGEGEAAQAYRFTLDSDGANTCKLHRREVVTGHVDGKPVAICRGRLTRLSRSS